jgi:hypothetical protein
VSRNLMFRMTSLLLLVWMSLPALAQQFSAEMVRQKPAGSANSKVFVSGGKVRLETAAQAHPNYVILSLTQRQSAMVLPDSKSYILSPVGQVSPSIPFFVIDDPDHACPAWEKNVGKPKTCVKVGDDTVNGRSAVKYTGTSGNGDTGTAWVDRKLRFVIKWEGEKGAAELQNIQEGPQSASLFDIPSDYEKLDLAAAAANAKKRKAKTPPTK